MELCSWQCWLELCVWLTQETYPKSVLVFNLWTFRSWMDVYMHMYVPMSAILSVHVDICAWNKEYRRSALFLFSIPKILPLLFPISVHELYLSWQQIISLPLSLSYISSILYWSNRGIPIIFYFVKAVPSTFCGRFTIVHNHPYCPKTHTRMLWGHPTECTAAICWTVFPR